VPEPEPEAVMAPVVPLKHATLVVETIDTDADAVTVETVATVVAVQVFASETVTVYVLAAKPVIEDDVPPVDQE